jgi:thiol:disulfide interchange protein DsbD
VLAILTGLYPLGLFRLPHDMPGKFTFGRLAFAAPFLALAALLGVRLFTSYQPSDWVSENIAAFAPPRIEGGTQDGPKTDEEPKVFSPYLDHDDLEYALDFFQALDYARENNLPLFVDFTGMNCVNCRKMEQQVLPLPQNRERLEKFVRVQLFTDTIPIVKDKEEHESLLKLNRGLQVAFGDVVLPGYVVLNPHDLAENGRLKPLSSFIGMEKSTGEFAKFLDKGLEKFQEQSSEQSLQSANRQGNNAGSTNVRLAAQP